MGGKAYKKELVIPPSIKYEKKEYTVTSIHNCTFKDEDIGCGHHEFTDTSVESISIPASVINIDEIWCEDTAKLTAIKIDPGNQYYSYFDDKFIIGKSDIANDFDVLIFARRDIVEGTIPPFIKIIGPYAFAHCNKLQKLIIPQNSQLKQIGRGAFNYSSIADFKIPKFVKLIDRTAFDHCPLST
ncbi:hypothetical protein M9Y10_002252 [Tritrichomonas musculus]|uniref:Surface antigen BspA-like n=1 Tax=Tritrichomonas musculus TaxID=1915356 RepID=A0ABR2L9C5_9EUKA